MPNLYDKGRSGILIEPEPLSQLADHGNYLKNGWFETRRILSETLDTKISVTGANLSGDCYSIDLQIGKELLRFYFDNLGDRIIFRIEDNILKDKLKTMLSKYFKDVELVGDNKLLQVKPNPYYVLQYSGKHGKFNMVSGGKYNPYSDIHSYEWVKLGERLCLDQCSDFIKLMHEKYKWFKDKSSKPPSDAEIVKHFIKTL